MCAKLDIKSKSGIIICNGIFIKEENNMSECNHNCQSCLQDCGERQAESMLAPQNKKSNVKKVIAVVSGKGGVGKSLVTSLLSVISQKRGNKTAILDADITGPSIPKTFNLKDNAIGTDDGAIPVTTKTGIKVMSLNLLLPDETEPVIWRGPIVGGAVQQFWTDVVWGDVDLMFVDCPPGTGDVPLTVFQSLPVDGIVIVTSPQELVSMIVEKAVRMAKMMKVPVLGIVENMSYFVCPNCEEKHYIFGQSHIDEIAKQYGIEAVAKIPMDSGFAQKVDKGEIEDLDGEWLTDVFDAIEKTGK